MFLRGLSIGLSKLTLFWVSFYFIPVLLTLSLNTGSIIWTTPIILMSLTFFLLWIISSIVIWNSSYFISSILDTPISVVSSPRIILKWLWIFSIITYFDWASVIFGQPFSSRYSTFEYFLPSMWLTNLISSLASKFLKSISLMLKGT